MKYIPSALVAFDSQYLNIGFRVYLRNSLRHPGHLHGAGDVTARPSLSEAAAAAGEGH